MIDAVYIETFSALRAPIFKDNVDFYKKLLNPSIPKAKRYEMLLSV